MIDSRMCRRIAHVVMLAALLVSFLSTPVRSQSNAVLQWTEVNKPGAAGHIIVNPSEINKIAVSSSDVIYSLDSANGKLYKSVNGGITVSLGVNCLRAIIWD